MELIIDSIEAIPEAAREFIKATAGRRVIAFDARMGAGKTTFISAVCRALGVTDDVSSPTFSIVNEYLDGKGDLIYHFDCYRLENISEALDFGAEDYLESGNVCFIEWPDIIEPLLPEDTLRVKLIENADGSRTVIWNQ